MWIQFLISLSTSQYRFSNRQHIDAPPHCPNISSGFSNSQYSIKMTGSALLVNAYIALRKKTLSILIGGTLKQAIHSFIHSFIIIFIKNRQNAVE